MTRTETKDKIIELLSYLYKKTNQNIDIKDKKYNSLLEKCLDIFEKEINFSCIGINFLREYFIYQFCYWIDKRETKFKSAIMPSWLLNKSAFERWANKNKCWKYFNTMFEKEYRITFQRNFTKVNLEEIEEIERKRFYNRDEGLIHCVELSSFNKCSVTCINCKFKSICEDIN